MSIVEIPPRNRETHGHCDMIAIITVECLHIRHVVLTSSPGGSEIGELRTTYDGEPQMTILPGTHLVSSSSKSRPGTHLVSSSSKSRPGTHLVSSSSKSRPGTHLVSSSSKSRPGTHLVSSSSKSRPGTHLVSSYSKSRPGTHLVSSSSKSRPGTHLVSSYSKSRPGTHLVSSSSKRRAFAGGRGEHILRMLSGQLRGHDGSFHEQFPGVMPSVRIVQLE